MISFYAGIPYFCDKNAIILIETLSSLQILISMYDIVLKNCQNHFFLRSISSFSQMNSDFEMSTNELIQFSNMDSHYFDVSRQYCQRT